MAKFVLLYRAPVSFMDGMSNATPEQQQQAMAPWMAWFEKCGPALVDMGGPLANARTFDSSGESASDTDIAGFSVIEADSPEAARALVDGHPHIQWMDGCTVEMHQLMFPGG